MRTSVEVAQFTPDTEEEHFFFFFAEKLFPDSRSWERDSSCPCKRNEKVMNLSEVVFSNSSVADPTRHVSLDTFRERW